MERDDNLMALFAPEKIAPPAQAAAYHAENFAAERRARSEACETSKSEPRQLVL